MALGLQERPAAEQSWQQGEEQLWKPVPAPLRPALVPVREPPRLVSAWFRCDTQLRTPSQLFP
jgi:hypothetical protein